MAPSCPLQVNSILQGRWSLLLGAFLLPCLLFFCPATPLVTVLSFQEGLGLGTGGWWDLGWGAGILLADSLSEVSSASLCGLPPGLCLHMPAEGRGGRVATQGLPPPPGWEQLPKCTLKLLGSVLQGLTLLLCFCFQLGVLSRGASGCGPGFGVLLVPTAAEGWRVAFSAGSASPSPPHLCHFLHQHISMH